MEHAPWEERAMRQVRYDAAVARQLGCVHPEEYRLISKWLEHGWLGPKDGGQYRIQARWVNNRRQRG